MRVVSDIKGHSHRVTIPAHRSLKVGTLAAIVTDVAGYLEVDREGFSEELFG